MRNRFIFVPLAIAGILLFAWLVMLLWNHALVPATGWHEVTYWQAAGLLILSKIFFGFGGGRPGEGWRNRMGRRAWQNWESMAPEEREKFREAMRARYGRSWCEPRPPHEPEAPADR